MKVGISLHNVTHFCTISLLAVLSLTGCGGGGSSSGGISATASTTPQILFAGTPMSSFTPLTVSGGTAPYTFSYTGTLPTGLIFDANKGVVSGTPSASYAAENLTFSVKDANNASASTTSTVSFAVFGTGFVSQGGLIWMPLTSSLHTYDQAVTLCSSTINGLSGWRLPTEQELVTLANSGAMNGQGWSIGSDLWSSTPNGVGSYFIVYLPNPSILGTAIVSNTQAATCVYH